MKRDEFLDFGFCFEAPAVPVPEPPRANKRECRLPMPVAEPYYTGFDGAMEYQEIAKRMGISCQAAQNAFQRGMRKLASRPETMRKLYALAMMAQDMRMRREEARDYER